MPAPAVRIFFQQCGLSSLLSYKAAVLVSQEPFALKLKVQKPQTSLLWLAESRFVFWFITQSQGQCREIYKGFTDFQSIPGNFFFFNHLALPGIGLNNLKSTKISFPENIQKLDSVVWGQYVVVPNISY